MWPFAAFVIAETDVFEHVKDSEGLTGQEAKVFIVHEAIYRCCRGCGVDILLS